MQWCTSRLLDVVVEGGAGAGEHVAVAGGIDHHLGRDAPCGLPCSRTRTPLTVPSSTTGSRGPGVVARSFTPALQQHLLRQHLEPLRVDGRRPGDDAVEGRGALAPVARPWPGRASPSPRGAGPAIASAGRRSSSSSAKPRITWRPVQSVMRSIQITRPPVERPPRWL